MRIFDFFRFLHYTYKSLSIRLHIYRPYFTETMNSSNKSQKTKSSSTFVCRLCRKVHALKSCKRFRNMNTTERQEIVKKYGYCSNCLAHSHSQGSCFTKTGCAYCHGQHHSLLHAHSRLQKPSVKKTPKASERRIESSVQSTESVSTTQTTMKSSSLSNTTSLTAILQQNAATILPTVLVKIDTKEGKYYARCLLDSGSRMSCISKKFVEELRLTTLELDDETICPVILWSCVDSHHKIEVTLRVNNRITTRTPKTSLPESIKLNFKNFVLADKNFYKSSSIDIVLGVDVYSKIMLDGIFVRAGLPTAQNTIFGIILYGTFST